MEFGIFHEFPSLPGRSARRGIRAILRAGRRRRTLGARRDVAGRTALRSGAFGAVGAAVRRQRDRRAHPADEDRPRGAGAAAVPSAAPGRGGRDRRSDQPRAADLRRRPQRRGAHLRGIRRALCAKAASASPRCSTSCSKAWTQDTVSYQGKYPRFEDVTVVPKPYPAADAADPRRRHERRYVRIHRPAGPADLRRRALRDRGRDRAADCAPIARRSRRPAIRSAAACSSASPPISRQPTRRRAREAEPSLIHFYRQQAALLADSAKRAGVDGAERRAQTARRLETMTYEEALKGTVLIGSPGSVADRLEELRQELGLDGVLMELNCGGKIPHAERDDSAPAAVSGGHAELFTDPP